MIQNCVFLSHQHESAPPVHHLDQELRLRGIVPWVDKLPGGFEAGDGSVEEARRIIRDEAGAFVLYLTENVFDSSFIREIELPEALSRRRRQPDFPIVVATPEYRLGHIGPLTEQHFGFSLGAFHGYSLDSRAGESEGDFITRVARAILIKHLSTQIPSDRNHIEIQVSSREVLQGTPEELLRFDATRMIDGSVNDEQAWARFLSGMADAKQSLAERFGRPRLLVNGSKHFTSAFMTGRVFNRFPLDIRQTPIQIWRSDGEVEDIQGFSFDYAPGSYTLRTLLVEIATGEKDIANGVDALITSGQLANGGRLRVRPVAGRVDVTEQVSRSLARRVYSEIDKAANTKSTDQIHPFVAAPQAFMMTLATLFQGMPEVHLYERPEITYRKSMVVPCNI